MAKKLYGGKTLTEIMLEEIEQEKAMVQSLPKKERNKEWDGYKDVRELDEEEKDELKCEFFDTNMPSEVTDEELYERADGYVFSYADFACNMN